MFTNVNYIVRKEYPQANLHSRVGTLVEINSGNCIKPHLTSRGHKSYLYDFYCQTEIRKKTVTFRFTAVFDYFFLKSERCRVQTYRYIQIYWKHKLLNLAI